MVQVCSAYKCNQEPKRGSDISFHRFPRDVTLKKQWVLATRRENFVPSQNARICSKHFTPESFNTSPWSSRKSLKSDAVPSIFDFPDHLVKKVKPRKPPALRTIKVEHENLETNIKQETNEETSTEPPLEPLAKKKRLFYIGDFNEHSLSVYDLAVKRQLLKKNKQIKILKQKNRRLTKKISDLEFLLQHLGQKQMIDEESSI